MAQDRREGPFEQLGETVGGAVGKAAGRMNDMALGAFGSVLETLGDWWSSSDARQASGAFDERVDGDCRQHFEQRSRGATSGSAGTASGTAGATGASSYDGARPAYQFGYVAGRNPEYQSRPFDQVEADVERAWRQAGSDRLGDWSDVRENVRYGYTYRTPGAPNPT